MIGLGKLERTATCLMLTFVLFGSLLTTSQLVFAQQDSSVAPLSSEEEGEGFGNVTLSSPQRESFATTPAPVEFGEDVIEELETRTEKTLNSPSIGVVNETATPPPNGTALQLINETDLASTNQTTNITQPTIMPTSLESPQTDPSAIGTLQVFINQTVTPSQSRSVVGEPSVANKGPIVFYTGNWYVARSNDNGSTWRYLNPLDDMSDFCCDQDVIYDSNNGVFIWYRQGDANDLTGINRARIGISPDATNWWFYNIKPTDLNPSWSNQWLDYPHLALSNKHLYFTSNLFDNFGDFVRTVIVRLPLEDLVNARIPAGQVHFSNQVGTFTPVQGAKDTMYWAAHVDNARMALYKWGDDLPANTIQRNVVEVPVWTLDPTLYDCPTPAADNNWCARSDQRITNGWISGSTVGFFWNVDKGGEFPWPYVEAASFDADSMTYQGRPLIWSPNFAVLYAFAAPNEKGQIGLISTFGGAQIEPSIAAAINQVDQNGNLSSWILKPIINGTHVPIENEWGDYLRVRPYNVSESVWTATGYTLQGGSTMAFVEPRLLVFGMVNSTDTNPASISTTSLSNSVLTKSMDSTKVVQTYYTPMEKKELIQR